MTDEEIKKLVSEEFKTPKLAVTNQYLEIHDAVYNEEGIKIDRIDREEPNDIIIVYLPVKNEYFYFAVYINAINKEIQSVGTESRNMVCFRATSDILSSDELNAFTKLSPTRMWNKGDWKPNKKVRHKFSLVEFVPNPEPDMVEHKLKKLLDFLEADQEGILILSTNAYASIDIYMDFHAGNQILGGLNINKDLISRIQKLNLEIEFNCAAWGIKFKD